MPEAQVCGFRDPENPIISTTGFCPFERLASTALSTVLPDRGEDSEKVYSILAGFGVSNGGARRLLNEFERQSSQQLEFPMFYGNREGPRPEDHAKFERAGLIVPLTYKAIPRRYEIDAAIDNAEKRLRKRSSEHSFASLAYGLLLLVEADVVGTSISGALRSFGLHAVRGGLTSLACSSRED